MLKATTQTEKNFPNFKLTIKQHNCHTSIRMSLLTQEVNTKDFPATYKYLQKMLPSILRSTCYNDENLPFFEEVKQTELGHLFEHILLEYLCMLKIKKGHKRATYKGNTQWDWMKDPKGTFHITANVGKEDVEILDEAVDQTTELFNLLLAGKSKIKVSHKPYKQVVSVSPVYMTMGQE